jgi:hypothetical protein
MPRRKPSAHWRVGESRESIRRVARFLLQFKVVWAQYRCGDLAKIHDVILTNHEDRDTNQ